METPSLSPVGMAMLPFDVIMLIACIHPHVYAVLRQLCKRFRNIIDRRLSRESAANLFTKLVKNTSLMRDGTTMIYTERPFLPCGYRHGLSRINHTGKVSGQPIKISWKYQCRYNIINYMAVVHIVVIKNHIMGKCRMNTAEISWVCGTRQRVLLDILNDVRITTTYDAHNNVTSEIILKHNRRHGISKLQQIDGTMVETNYVNGNIHGQVRTLRNDGTIYREATYAGHYLKGLEKIYYPNGTLQLVKNYATPVKGSDGVHMFHVKWEESYHPNGNRAVKNWYKGGSIIPYLVEIWDVDGHLIT
jgi:hypothetical protein